MFFRAIFILTIVVCVLGSLYVGWSNSVPKDTIPPLNFITGVGGFLVACISVPLWGKVGESSCRDWIITVLSVALGTLGLALFGVSLVQ